MVEGSTLYKVFKSEPRLQGRRRATISFQEILLLAGTTEGTKGIVKVAWEFKGFEDSEDLRSIPKPEKGDEKNDEPVSRSPLTCPALKQRSNFSSHILSFCSRVLESKGVETRACVVEVGGVCLGGGKSLVTVGRGGGRTTGSEVVRGEESEVVKGMD